MNLSDANRAKVQRFKDSFQYYGSQCLWLLTKEGALQLLQFNRIQRYLDARLNEQLEETGKVRALVLKGRQQGVSTYVAGRFYHRCVFVRGTRVFILTHETDATNNLFGMVERYHKKSPFAPSTDKANAKELKFGARDSGYAVGTAGAVATGRSQTVRLLHGSEVAFWKNAPDHFAGVVQAVPDMPGTEIILESTANGMGGEFHLRWQQAERGECDYIAIFIPWFWQEEYAKPVPPGFVLSDEDEEYRAAHNLKLEQMAWRDSKIAELNDPKLFMQEYPATATEAFQLTGHDSFIKPELVLRARKQDIVPYGELIVGVDPALQGDDQFAVAWRTGRKISDVQRKPKTTLLEGAGWCKQILDDDKPARMFIDAAAGGNGAAIIDLLNDWGYGEIVKGVNFGDPPIAPPRFDPKTRKKIPGPKNRRAEMWLASRTWLEDPLGADIPDQDWLHTDACAPSYSHTSSQDLLLESKKAMRARSASSPDGWDAAALTFAEPVAPKCDDKVEMPAPRAAGGGFMGHRGR